MGGDAVHRDRHPQRPGALQALGRHAEDMGQRPAQRRQGNTLVQGLELVQQTSDRNVLHGVLVNLEAAFGGGRGDLHELSNHLIGVSLRRSRVVEHRQINVLAQSKQPQVIAVVRGAVLHQRHRRIGPLGVVRLVFECVPDSQRQRVVGRHPFQQRDIALRRTPHVVDAGQTGAIQLVDEVEQIPLQLLLGDLGHLFVEPAVGWLPGNQGRTAVVGAGRRRHAHGFQGQAVGVHRLIGDLEKKRVVGSRGIEFLQSEPARSVGELVFTPAALHHEPFPPAPWRRLFRP